MFELVNGGAPSGVAPTAAAPSERVVRLQRAVGEVAAEEPAQLTGVQALAEATALVAELEKLTMVVLRRLGDVDQRGLHSLVAASSTATWLGQQSTGLGRGSVASARRLRCLPRVQREVLSGRLPVRSAQQIASALDQVGPFLDRPDGLLDGQSAEPVIHAVITLGALDLVCEARGGMPDNEPLLGPLAARLEQIAAAHDPAVTRLEAAFVVVARHVEPAQLPSALARLVDALLPQQLEERAERSHQQRGLDLRRKPDGSGWTISKGELDLECGELLWTVLQTEMATDPDNPVDTAANAAAREGWGQLPECGGARSLRQRRHDALRCGLRRYLDTGVAGLRDKAVPHLAVTVSLRALEQAPGALLARSAAGTTLPTQLVLRWACDSAITRFVLSLGRRVIEMSHTARTLTVHERRIKHVETGSSCQAAGCTRGPGFRLVPHHPVPFALSGCTSVGDTVMVCEQTHHDLHEGGRTIRLKDGRYLGPRGWATGPAG